MDTPETKGLTPTPSQSAEIALVALGHEHGLSPKNRWEETLEIIARYGVYDEYIEKLILEKVRVQTRMDEAGRDYFIIDRKLEDLEQRKQRARRQKK
jgi:hypothetical protein